jgi:pSer/pThr/pTyr-binding forkhead associated (FHA) protein
MRAQLVPVEHGPPLEISKDMTLVGRGEECDLRIEHKCVSKVHCVIVRTDGLLFVRDLGSTNGTRVNGQRIRRAALLPNDQLSIASLKYRVLFGEKALPVSPEERTQHIEAAELDQLMRKKKTDLDYDSEEMPAVAIEPNSLPDVYPEEEKPHKAEPKDNPPQ